MRKKPTRKRPYFKMESAMTVILRDASEKMHHGILFDPPLVWTYFLLKEEGKKRIKVSSIFLKDMTRNNVENTFSCFD